MKQFFKENKIIILILILALSLRLYFFTGLNYNDDLVYLNFAHDITTGNFLPHPYIFATRLMMLYPIAFFFNFTINEFTASLYILICSLGSVLLAYLIGKELFNKQTGQIAAILLAFMPLEIIYATTIVPDVPVAFFLTLSIYLFIKGKNSGNKKLSYLAGISFGLAWLVKTLAIIYALFFLAYLILDLVRKIKFTKAVYPYFILFLGFLSVLLIEGFIYLSLGHSFFTGLNTNQVFYSPDLLGVNNNLSYYQYQLLNYNVGKYFHYFGFYFYFALLSTLFIVLARKKEAYAVIAWLLSILLFMQFGSMSLADYTLMHKLYRFLTIIAVPTCLLAAYIIFNLKPGHYKLAKYSLLAFLLISSLFYTYYASQYLEKSIADLKVSAKFLADKDKKIYADETTIGHYRFLFGYKKNDMLYALDYVNDTSIIHDSYIVIDSNRGYIELENLRSRLPKEVHNPPLEWQKVLLVEESDIDVYRNYNTTVYYIP